ncbi:6693_t:CDS:2, partial [Racocetra persica]
KGETVQVCKIINNNSDRCDQKYYNIGSSTRNLIAHLQDIHQIINKNESEPKPKRLIYLKDAIIQLEADLYISVNREDKKDGIKLKKIILSEDDKMIPTIKELTFDLAGNLSNNIDYLDNNTVFDSEDFEEIEVDNEEATSNITKNKISIKYPLDTRLMASLLDPCFKELELELESDKNQIIQKL